ncbi:hypothetical protein [Riemerella columbipharyngis]|uniref:Uncharacterized protein n=1 Tax=Riemerella columbipharyngis TaxID=1071918 RepID=A0A1G7DX13_9FLAO|nr:hypothetical protein [Riemerella columbipharyngis]SDE56009.1 hypothetical protein SAMN05421544_11315 [Riemerella columbipharyngis]
MTDLELLHFEQLKKEVQNRFLERHTPSEENISKWKGIDIVYFQEDLRKLAKGSLSEKSFYTYFKTSPVTKIPRIDLLNILSIYCGYASWHEFKKNHLFSNEILKDTEIITEEKDLIPQEIETDDSIINEKKLTESKAEKQDLQKTYSEKQKFNQNTTKEKSTPPLKKRKRILILLSILLVLLLGVGITYSDNLFINNYSFKFIDADRNSAINDYLDIKVFKEGETPLLFKVKPNEIFTYKTKESSLAMEVSSPYYKTDTIVRNYSNNDFSEKYETIELKPNEYAQMLYYYSRSPKDLKRKIEQLNELISDEALIYQVYDSNDYGVETLNKERYIALVTTPTNSLKHLDVINTKMKNGKIILIKFKISTEK